MITIESIKEKLGFDPMNPPSTKEQDSWLVDDATPCIWSPLNDEEHLFVMEHCMGVSKEFIARIRAADR